jgi:hypothetical protein
MAIPAGQYIVYHGSAFATESTLTMFADPNGWRVWMVKAVHASSLNFKP